MGGICWAIFIGILIGSVFRFHGIGVHVQPAFLLSSLRRAHRTGLCTKSRKFAPILGQVELFSFLERPFFWLISFDDSTVRHFDFTELISQSSGIRSHTWFRVRCTMSRPKSQTWSQPQMPLTSYEPCFMDLRQAVITCAEDQNSLVVKQRTWQQILASASVIYKTQLPALTIQKEGWSALQNGNTCKIRSDSRARPPTKVDHNGSLPLAKVILIVLARICEDSTRPSNAVRGRREQPRRSSCWLSHCRCRNPGRRLAHPRRARPPTDVFLAGVYPQSRARSIFFDSAKRSSASREPEAGWHAKRCIVSCTCEHPNTKYGE